MYARSGALHMNGIAAGHSGITDDAIQAPTNKEEDQCVSA